MHGAFGARKRRRVTGGCCVDGRRAPFAWAGAAVVTLLLCMIGGLAYVGAVVVVRGCWQVIRGRSDDARKTGFLDGYVHVGRMDGRWS